MRMGIELSQANGRLDNLGHDMDTRRFRNITDLKETKILLNTLFQKLANEKVVEKRALDQKINAQVRYSGIIDNLYCYNILGLIGTRIGRS